MRISDWSSDVCSSDLGRQPLDLAVYLAAQSLQLVDPREVLRAARLRDIAGERLSHVLNVAEADRLPALDRGIDAAQIVVRRGVRRQRIARGANLVSRSGERAGIARHAAVRIDGVIARGALGLPRPQ